MSRRPGLPEPLRALLQPAAYPHPVTRIELVETHVSWVLLTGPFAYKIKRPVHYAFVDLRSPQRRAHFCREELRLNQRFAAELYLDVVPITVHEGRARIGGEGTPIEHAVRMRQFPREEELDRLLAAGRIEPAELEDFGRALAQVHALLPVAGADEPWGRFKQVREQLLENLRQTAQSATVFGDDARLAALQPLLAARIDSLARWLSQRRESGCVRECHGDLHARNIVRSGGRLVAFDCMEFAAEFRWIDVAHEVAFLLSDLQAMGHPVHGQAFLGGYLAQCGDYAACRVLDLYLAHCALIRAKVEALSIASGAGARDADRAAARREFDRRLAVARAALEPKRPQLILMAGLSGSGKTWLASQLAPRLGAIHVRSDVERKRLAGLPDTARAGTGVGQGLYTAQAKAQVYGHLVRCAEAVLDGGRDLIVDATFARREDREPFFRMAAQRGLVPHLLHCRATPAVLRQRVAARHARGTDASDADLAVLQWQETRFEPVQAAEGIRIVEVDTTGSEPAPGIEALVDLLRANQAGNAHLDE